MAIYINLYYTGENDSAKRFAREMISSGLVAKIRGEEGNLRYDYFYPANDDSTVLLIDAWRDQSALDAHHNSPMMLEIARLREKYGLHMTAERFVSASDNPSDAKYIRK